MLMAQRANLDMIAHFIKRNLSEDDYKKFIKNISKGMTATIEISNDLYERYPDIIPAELRAIPQP